MLDNHVLKQMNEDELRNYVLILQEMLSLTGRKATVRGEINDFFKGLLAAKEEEHYLSVDFKETSKRFEDYTELLLAHYGLHPVYDMPEREVSDGK